MRLAGVIVLAALLVALGGCGGGEPDEKRIGAAVDRISEACGEPGGLASADASNRVTESVDAIIEEYRKNPGASTGEPDPVTKETTSLRDSLHLVATMLDTICGSENGKRLERALRE